MAGASGGINLAIAASLAAAGAKVAVVSRDPGRIEAAAQSIRDAGDEALGLAADVRDYAQVEAAIVKTAQAFGSLDIVISGAAGNFLAPASGLSANGFKTVIDIDLIGTFNVLRASFDHLTKPGASLISITAPQGVRATVNQAHACAAKAGVNMLTKVLALEWG
ncbi:MAG TPA: SDR family NAD(P)-dependent oxidoreductase, partial [Caulobacteraceae bacterium]|nr:SDR family NAD(P)-dependent oxidoreductase [Caulobacteraceae bacterium]